MKTYKINEIFESLQGEGYHSGLRVTFIRFAGCNLDCYFCDTDHSTKLNMTTDEIIKKISILGNRHLVLTGGEPLLQLDKYLLALMSELGYIIHIETNGTINADSIEDLIDWLTVSPKSINNVNINKCNELKLVLDNPEEAKYYEFIKADHYFIQPMEINGKSNSKDCINFIMNNKKGGVNWRLSIQDQKILKIK